MKSLLIGLLALGSLSTFAQASGGGGEAYSSQAIVKVIKTELQRSKMKREIVDGLYIDINITEEELTNPQGLKLVYKMVPIRKQDKAIILIDEAYWSNSNGDEKQKVIENLVLDIERTSWLRLIKH